MQQTLSENNYNARIYDSKAEATSTSQNRTSRARGPAYPLKAYHNAVKRALISRFAYGAGRLLDLGCGRGGDLHKWKGARIGYVKGLDLSGKSVEEARRRHGDLDALSSGMPRVDFEQTSVLGQSVWVDRTGTYHAVTCMFALHYFFESEATLDTLLATVAHNLAPGGHFFGVVPDGKHVMTVLRDQTTYDSPMLRVERRWTGDRACYGSAYTCALGDTVTEGESHEYLVFASVLLRAARKHGLEPVAAKEYNDAKIKFNRLLTDGSEDRNGVFRHFAPRFPTHADPSLTTASELFAAFCFRKAAADQEPPPRKRPKHTDTQTKV